MYTIDRKISPITQRERFHVWSPNGVHMKAFDTRAAAQRYIDTRLRRGKL